MNAAARAGCIFLISALGVTGVLVAPASALNRPKPGTSIATCNFSYKNVDANTSIKGRCQGKSARAISIEAHTNNENRSLTLRGRVYREPVNLKLKMIKPSGFQINGKVGGRKLSPGLVSVFEDKIQVQYRYDNESISCSTEYTVVNGEIVWSKRNAVRHSGKQFRGSDGPKTVEWGLCATFSDFGAHIFGIDIQDPA